MIFGENRFCFVAPMFNASKTLARMLHSLCGQSYQNWQLILIDDVSTDFDKSLQVVYQFLPLIDNRLTFIKNHTKKWEVANVLHGISLCKNEDIICRIDADDALCDLDALAIMNSVYNNTNCDVAWSQHRWGMSDRNISGPLGDSKKCYESPWVSSHLKTFRKKLINNVCFTNFLNQDGDLVKRCGDQAIYLPVIYKSERCAFVPRPLYSYTIDEQGGAVYQTEDAKFQKEEAEFIRSRGFVSTGTHWEDHTHRFKNQCETIIW